MRAENEVPKICRCGKRLTYLTEYDKTGTCNSCAHRILITVRLKNRDYYSRQAVILNSLLKLEGRRDAS